MKLNKNAVRQFKRLFHDKRVATFQLIPEKPNCTVKAKVVHMRTTKETLNKLAKWNKDGAAITMLIAKGDGLGRKKENIKSVSWLFVDVDGGMGLKGLKKLPIRPHLIVGTSPSRYHAYWKLKGLRIAQFPAIQRGLAKKLKTDESVVDVTRTMRVAGSVHWKDGKSFLAHVVHESEHVNPIDLSKFLGGMNLAVPVKLAGDEEGTELTAEKRELLTRVEAALDTLSAESRYVWLSVGMAIHSEFANSLGYELWKKWSGTSPDKYVEKDQEKTWARFKAEGGVGIGTLFHLAGKVTAGDGGGGVPDNELDLAEMFVRNHAQEIRFIQPKDWMVWDGNVWRKDYAAAYRLAQAFISTQERVLKKSNPESKLMKNFQRSAALRTLLLHAGMVEAIQATRESFDSRSDLIATKNGVIELQSGTIRQSHPADMVSRTLGVSVDADATCSTWENFVLEICDEDKQLALYLQKAVGYTMYGHTQAQVFFILLGSGANGKGVFLKTVHRLFGEYSLPVSPALLLRAYSNANGPSPAMAKIVGRRFLMCTEVTTGKPFDEAFVKQLTGSDPLSTRGLYSDQEEFDPVGKLWLSANSMPRVRFDDKAMWRRIVPIPFDRSFTGAKADPELENKLIGEMQGIVRWATEGARMYAAEQLKPCAAIKRLRKQLRGDADTVGAWIANSCRETRHDQLQAADAYDSYSTFMRTQQKAAVSVQEFKAAMVRKGFKHKRTKLHNFYIGLRLLST